MTFKAKGKSDEWQTPEWLFRQLNNRFKFTVDAAANINNRKINTHFIDGLNYNWTGQRVFCNPPFSSKADWIRKMHYEIFENNCPLCVMILPNCIDTKAFNQYIHGTFHWEHLPFRVSFLDEQGNEVKGNPSGIIIVYVWKSIDKQIN